MYVLDGQRTILFCNAACADWLGVEEEALVGRQCNYHGGAPGASEPGGEAADDDRPALLAARLCPPPEVFDGCCRSAEVHPPGSDESVPRRVLFVPLEDADGGAVLAVAHAAGEVLVGDGDVADEGREARQLHQQLLQLRREFGLDRAADRLRGESIAARRMRDQLQAACASRVRVVLVGGAGSGAETLAHDLHHRRPEPRGRLVPLACPLLDAELVQATITELKRPAAYRDSRPQGTLLLLDVDQLSSSAQDELAGFLMLPGFELHTIATSAASLPQLAEMGEFRRDLASALATLEIVLTPLAERSEDIPLLTQQLLEAGNARGGKQLTGFTSEALDMLAAYPWPGDVDELAGMIDRARESAAGPLVGVSDLPERVHLAAHAAAYPPRDDEPIELDRLLADIESELIHRALERAKGNKSKAAQLLGVTRARLHRRLAQGEEETPRPEPVEEQAEVQFEMQPDFREIGDEDDL